MLRRRRMLRSIRADNNNIVICVLLVFVACLADCVHGCGPLTHNEVAKRSLLLYNFEGYEEFIPWIQQYQDAFQAGADFPDWGYPQAAFHSASEDAHWPPFYLSAAKYLHAKYPKPWGPDAQKLAVFLLGASSHMVADILWHSLDYLPNGFIQAMSRVEFLGDYETAHGIADEGGDVMLAYQFDVSFVHDVWDFPIEDVMGIYHSYGRTDVDLEHLAEGFTMLYSAGMALKYGGELLYHDYAHKSPFLVDQYQDYIVGGVDDMAAWTAKCWPYILNWLANSTNDDICYLLRTNMPANDTTTATTNNPSYAQLEAKKKEVEPERLTMIKEKMHLSAQRTTSSGNLVLSGADKVKLPQIDYPTSPKQAPISFAKTETSTLYSTTPYSYFGTAMRSVDLNNDSISDLIISAPGNAGDVAGGSSYQLGCVYIVLGKKGIPSEANIDNYADDKICGAESHGKFGWAVEVIDFNLDGVLDLAISSPSNSSDMLTYHGFVYVYFGQLSGQIWKRGAQPDVVISDPRLGGNLGFVLTKADVNGDGFPDLVSGAPYANQSDTIYECGCVSIFTSSPQRKTNQTLGFDDAYWVQWGGSPFEHYGFNIQFTEIAGNMSYNALLLVGSPSYTYYEATSSSWLPAAGRLTVWMFNSDIRNADNTVLYGARSLDRLGLSFSVTTSSLTTLHSQPILALSLTTRNISKLLQAGTVLMLPLAVLTSSQIVDAVKPFVAFEGIQEFSRFGALTQFTDLTTSSASPNGAFFSTYPLWHSLLENEVGCVCMWEMGASFPSGTITDPLKSANKIYKSSLASSSSTDESMTKDARFGSSIVFGDVNGDRTTDIIISSTRYSKFAYLAGAVEVIIS